MVKRLWYLTLVVVLAGAAAACAAPTGATGTEAPEAPDAPISSGGPVFITFACDSHLIAEYERLAAEFNATHDDIVVQVRDMNTAMGLKPGEAWGSDGYERMAEAADTALMYVWSVAMREGTLYDLTPFVDNDWEAVDADDFYPGTLEFFHWRGRQWAIPTRISMNVIYYDREAVAETGLPEPRPGWTYDEFTDLALALNRPESEGDRRYGFVNTWPDYTQALVVGRSGPLYSVSAGVVEPHLDRPRVIDAVAWYAGLADAMPPVDVNGSAARELVQTGRAGMWAGWAGSWECGAENQGVAPFPFDGEPSTPMMVQAYTMSAGTRHPDAAWTWLDWVSRQQIPDVRLPARRSVAESSRFWTDLAADDPRCAEAYRFALEHAFPVQEQSASLWGLGIAIEDVWRGAKPVDALGEMQERLEGLVAQWANMSSAADRGIVVSPPDPTPRPDQSVVRFVSSLTDRYTLGELVSAFEDEHPGTDVQVLGAGWEDVAETAARADCFVAPLQVDTGPLLDLEPLLAAGLELPLDDFYPQYVDPFRVAGSLYGLPAEVAPVFLEANQNVLYPAGIELPSNDSTWDEVVDVASRVTAEGAWGYAPLAAGDVALLLRARGVELIDVDADPPRPLLTDPAAEAGLAWLMGEGGLGLTMPPEALEALGSGDYTDVAGLVLAEQVALWLSGGRYGYEVWGLDELGATRRLLPLAPGGYVDGWVLGYYVSTGAESPEACLEWIAWLSERPEAQGEIAPRRSAVESVAFDAVVGPRHMGVYRAAAAREGEGAGWLGSVYALGLDPLFTWLARAAQDVGWGGEPDVALGVAQDLAEEYVACLAAGGGLAGGDEAVRDACLYQVDPGYAGAAP